MFLLAHDWLAISDVYVVSRRMSILFSIASILSLIWEEITEGL